MALSPDGLKHRLSAIKKQLDELEGSFVTEENSEDFRYALDEACIGIDDAIEVIERDEAFKLLQAQMKVTS